MHSSLRDFYRVLNQINFQKLKSLERITQTEEKKIKNHLQRSEEHELQHAKIFCLSVFAGDEWYMPLGCRSYQHCPTLFDYATEALSRTNAGGVLCAETLVNKLDRSKYVPAIKITASKCVRTRVHVCLKTPPPVICYVTSLSYIASLLISIHISPSSVICHIDNQRSKTKISINNATKAHIAHRSDLFC